MSDSSRDGLLSHFTDEQTEAFQGDVIDHQIIELVLPAPTDTLLR